MGLCRILMWRQPSVNKIAPMKPLVSLTLAGLASGTLLLTALPAWAIIPLTVPPLPERIALADLIVIGKVTSLDSEPIDALPLLPIPGVSKQVTYRIVNITVSKPLLGAKAVTRVRVGFVPPMDSRKPAPFKLARLALHQDGCFFLRKHPQEPFYVASASYDVMDKTDAKEYSRELAELTRCMRLLADPQAGLRAKQADNRLLTAALLIYRYRTPRHIYRGKPKTEPIEAAECKELLGVLAEADWTAKGAPPWRTPLSMFLRLGVTEEDGWQPPALLSEVAPAAQRWLREHGATYRIHRYLPPT
jgi:hypothetical protein